MGRTAFQSKSRIAPSRPVPAPQSTVSSVMPLPSGTGPTLGQSIKDGFGLGIGSAIGHRIVSGIFGAPTVNVTTAPREPTAFEKCISEHRDDVALCAHLAEKK